MGKLLSPRIWQKLGRVRVIIVRCAIYWDLLSHGIVPAASLRTLA